MARNSNEGLICVGNCWHLNMRIPKELGGGRLRTSLRTSDSKRARYIRDTYVNPVLSQAGAIAALEDIAETIRDIRETSLSKLDNLKRDIFGGGDIFLKDCVEKYVAYVEHSGLKENTVKAYVTTVEQISGIVKNKHIDSLTKEDAALVRDTLIKDLSTKRLSFIFQTFRQFLRWCEKEGLAIKGLNDRFHINLPQVRSEHTPMIPEEKADDAMLCRPEWTIVPRIARYTGMRLQEVLSLSKNKIMTEHGVRCFYLGTDITKTHSERYVPIADKLLPYIGKLDEISGESKDFKTYNRRIKKVEGCDKCKFHSWRVFANTTMQKAGIDRAVRMKILGHKADKDDIHSGYTAVDIQQMKKAIDKIP
jgi:integrase